MESVSSRRQPGRRRGWRIARDGVLAWPERHASDARGRKQAFDSMDRFDKFTDRARKVLTLAQDEAIEDAFAADKVEEIVEATAADEAAEEAAAGATVETIAEKVTEDEEAAEAAAAEEVATVARKTMEKNTEG